MSLVIFWHKPLKLENLETPENLKGKAGIYIITHDSTIFYIGKAGKGNAIVREAKNRENKYIKCLKQMGLMPSDENYYKYFYEHCRVYCGIVSDDAQQSDQLDFLLSNAEKLIIYEVSKVKLLCNKKSIRKYKSVKPFKVINRGESPPGLKDQYSPI